MSSAEHFAAWGSRARSGLRLHGLVLPVFATALFLSAFLLFSVQPMFTKMVLPRLGGSPGVWSVAMVFFQAALLAGYGYAHLLANRLTPRTAALTHLLLMVAVLLTALPIGLAAGFDRPPTEGQALWLIAVFALSVGLPFFAVAANGPLLQAWFARTGHPHAKDPYFLYGASNVGSLLALLSYPLLVEPFAPLGLQGRTWAFGFGALILAIALCALYVSRTLGTTVPLEASDAVSARETIGWRRRLTWIALAFVPSSLLIAVTAHISTDVAAAPFLWVVPLSLFLLTFIITFQRRPVLSHGLMLRLQPVVIALPALSLVGLSFNWGVSLVLHLAAFFITAMVCHGELVCRRPSAAHLTAFYLAMSFGGVLGGLFAGLIAPNVFDSIVEYPLLMIAGLLCRSDLWKVADRHRALVELICILGVGVLLVAPAVAFGFTAHGKMSAVLNIVLLAMAVGIMLQGRNPVRMVALAVTAMVFGTAYDMAARPESSVRSFFGVHKTLLTGDGRFRLLMHGSTLHGAMRLKAADGSPVEGRPRPTTYFFKDGTIGEAIYALRGGKGRLDQVAIVGVGSGSLACHRAAGEAWTFYDIDSDVVTIARDPAKFRFFSSCAPDAGFVLGDARLTLADAKDGTLDLLVLDAFSSDAIPVHLLTTEAMALYFRKLKDDGAAILHVSNRNMELTSVVAAIAAEQGLVAWTRPTDKRKFSESDVDIDPIAVVVARKETDLGTLPGKGRWHAVAPDPAVRPWTDDYANVVGAIWRHFVP